MPKRHKYIIVLSLDNQQIEQIKNLFFARFQIIVVNNKDILKFVQEDDGEIAGVIIDDKLDTHKIIDFLQICYDEEVYRRIPIFLLYDGQNNDLYVKSIRLGVDEIIRKPYDLDILERRFLHITDLFTNNHRLEWLVDIQTKELQESIRVLEDMKVQVLEAMGSLVEFRNMESGEHIYRVRFITDILMRELMERYPQYGITDEIISVTNMASILHDVGKIMVSDVILNKPGKLTREEFEEMKLHTYYGQQILEKFEGLYNDYTYHFYNDVIRFHHEKFDGKGYPKGLKGNEIPIWAQVVSLADVYDALTNERVYKRAFTHQEAKQMILNGECGHFNPDIIDCFIRAEDKIIDISCLNRGEKGRFTDNLIQGTQTSILNDYEKEKAFHRAYQELVSEFFFEFDIEYGTVQYMNAFGRQKEEKYVHENFPGMEAEDEDKLSRAISQSTPNHPLIQMIFNIEENGKKRRCQLTLRITWDMYTRKRTGGVGKIMFIDE